MSMMLNLIVSVLLVVNGSSGVSATRLDGSQTHGELLRWAQGQIVLETSSGKVVVEERDLLALDFQPMNSDGEDARKAIRLVDGSFLPIRDYRVEKDHAVINWDDRLSPDGPELRLPLALVAAARFQPLLSRAKQQWSEIQALRLPTDLLVAQRSTDGPLDYFEGVLGAVTDSHVRFIIDGEEIDVQRAKVAGLVYYHDAQQYEDADVGILKGKRGLSLFASDAKLAEDMIHVTTPAGIDVALPREAFYSADFSAGKVHFLSDLTPTHSHWEPLVGLRTGAQFIAGFGEPQKDRSLLGGPLTLVFAGDGEASGERIPRTFSRGLALRSRTELTYRLPDGFRRFSTIAGIDPQVDRQAHVVLTIRGDGRTLFESEVAATDEPQQIHLDVAGVRRLEIVVDYGDHLDFGDVLNLCDAKITK